MFQWVPLPPVIASFAADSEDFAGRAAEKLLNWLRLFLFRFFAFTFEDNSPGDNRGNCEHPFMLIWAQLPANQDLTARDLAKSTSKGHEIEFHSPLPFLRLGPAPPESWDMRDDDVQRVCGPDDLIMHGTFERDYGFVSDDSPREDNLWSFSVRAQSLHKLSSKI